MQKDKKFWEIKKLNEMTPDEWESLCDGCGKCCLEKVVFEDDGTLAFTNIACKLLNRRTCRCRHYATRRDFVPECVRMKPEEIGDYYWLPKTCAYRLINEGKPLPDWHPLITGDPASVKRAKMSAAGRCVSAKPEEEFQYYIVTWDDL